VLGIMDRARDSARLSPLIGFTLLGRLMPSVYSMLGCTLQKG